MVYGEAGAKLCLDDLFLGQGFTGSRAAPLLQSTESQLSTRGFVEEKSLFFRNEK